MSFQFFSNVFLKNSRPLSVCSFSAPVNISFVSEDPFAGSRCPSKSCIHTVSDSVSFSVERMKICMEPFLPNPARSILPCRFGCKVRPPHRQMSADLSGHPFPARLPREGRRQVGIPRLLSAPPSGVIPAVSASETLTADFPVGFFRPCVFRCLR